VSVISDRVSRVLRSLLPALLAGFFMQAFAAEEVLINDVPANVDKTVALTVAREALAYREWTFVSQDADSVSAKISRAGVDANIRISHRDGKLLYDTSARGRGRLDYTGRVVPSTTTTPERWIEFLRADITEGLQKRAAMAKSTPKPTEPPKVNVAAEPQAAKRGNATARMQELKELFDKGLISPEEHERKRAEILKDL
jgi:hypothetical protein